MNDDLEQLEMLCNMVEKLGEYADKANAANQDAETKALFLVELGKELEAKENKIRELEREIDRLKFFIDTSHGYNN